MVLAVCDSACPAKVHDTVTVTSLYAPGSVVVVAPTGTVAVAHAIHVLRVKVMPLRTVWEGRNRPVHEVGAQVPSHTVGLPAGSVLGGVGDCPW